MSRRQSNQIVKDVKVNDVSICDSNEISNAFNEHFSTIGPRLAREIPLISDEESIYLKNVTENYNKFCFRPTTTSDVCTVPQMIPRPQMIPQMDRKWSSTASDPQSRPQMIPKEK